MGYKNINDILPYSLIRVVQQYIDGEYVYIPRKEIQKQPWDEWLQSLSQHTGGDIPMMEAGAGKYFNIIQLVGRKT